MTRFLADENFNNQIVRGVLRQSPDIDIVRVQDVDLSGADDPTVLAWAAQERRIVLTHIETVNNQLKNISQIEHSRHLFKKIKVL